MRKAGDAMEGVVYPNDSQVVDCHVRKRYADNGQPVGALLKIQEFKPQEVQNEISL